MPRQILKKMFTTAQSMIRLIDDIGNTIYIDGSVCQSEVQYRKPREWLRSKLIFVINGWFCMLG